MAPSQTTCSMTFAMSPGYTNETENGGRRAGSLPGSASACEAITSFAFESRSARLLLAQALHNRAAPWSWLPLRTRTRCLAGGARQPHPPENSEVSQRGGESSS